MNIYFTNVANQPTDYTLDNKEAQFFTALQAHLDEKRIPGSIEVRVMPNGNLNVSVGGLGIIGAISLRGRIRFSHRYYQEGKLKEDWPSYNTLTDVLSYGLPLWIRYVEYLQFEQTKKLYSPDKIKILEKYKWLILLQIGFNIASLGIFPSMDAPGFIRYFLITVSFIGILAMIIVLFLCIVKRIERENVEKAIHEDLRLKTEMRRKIAVETAELEKRQKDVTSEYFIELENNIRDDKKRIQDLTDEIRKKEYELSHINEDANVKQKEKIKKYTYLLNSIKSYIEHFSASEFTVREKEKIEQLLSELGIEDLMSPTVEAHLHSTDMKDLKKQYRQICRDIEETLRSYESRYTTKGNLAIYRLMVVALRSELQNVLSVMKFGKLGDAEDQIRQICDKYIQIAADGNAQIAPTITRFVKQMESLFLDAVRVEYEYYLRKGRAKEEQKAIREQMKQEAEERRRLEAEQKKIEEEEKKYTAEMEKLRGQMKDASADMTEQLLSRIHELEEKMTQVSEKKESIAKLQNGKAGYVYVISNLGSFGDHVFKIGMTRRMEPQERIDELGDASVPFSFDVHSMIFSEDASTLETAIHHRLNNRRVNKINLRKEFFNISIDELATLVHEIQPTAEFTRTMAAEQYRQSLSMETCFDGFSAEEEALYDDDFDDVI